MELLPHKTPEEMAKQNKATRQVLIGLVVFCVAVYAVIVGVNAIFAPYQTVKPADAVNRSEVVAACQSEARSRLKYPETVEFPNFLEQADTPVSLVNGRAVLKSWVRAKNGFGVVQKMTYICNVNPDGSGVVNLGMLTQ